MYIYLKDGRIHLSKTQLALIPNFGRGGMRKFMDESDARRDSTVYHAALAGIQVADDKKDACFWRKVLKFAGKSVVNKEDLHDVDERIQSNTGWEEPVDTLTSYAYMQKCGSPRGGKTED